MELPFTLRTLHKDAKLTLICVCLCADSYACVCVCVHVNSFSRFGGRSTKMSDSFPVHTPPPRPPRPLLHYFKLQTLQPSLHPQTPSVWPNCTTPITLAQLLLLLFEQPQQSPLTVRCSLNCSAAVDALLSSDRVC